MDIEWYYYVAFVAFVIAMLGIDLKFFHSDEHEPTMKESATWVAVWVSLALIFGLGILLFADRGGARAGEFFAGYLIEYSLSVDNMFVFVVIFTYFRVPLAYQHQVLFYGILGAIVFRGIFIAVGVALINNFEWMIYVFGAFLIYTAIRIARGTEEVHPEENPVLKFFQRRFRTTPRFDGQKLFTIENGKRVATPLFVTLLFVETTDILFALDSIPAIFAITRDSFIILTSNVFAILGLRALYFLLAGSMERFHLLRYGLAVVLGFVGAKMLLEYWDVHVPIYASLAFICFVLGMTVFLSLKIPPPIADVVEEPEDRFPRPDEKEPSTKVDASQPDRPAESDVRGSGRG